MAVQRFIDHLDLNGADDLAWLCAAIEPAARAAYGDPATLQRLAGGAPPVVVDLPRQRALSCPLLELSLFGGGNVPKVIGSAGTARTVRRIAPSQAIVVAALTHHFLPSSSVPHGGRVHAMVPVLTMRDSVGRWYVSTPGQLLPLAAFDDPAQIERPRDIVAYLHRRRAALLQRERASVSGLAHELAGLRADTVPIETSPACAGARSSGLSDPAGDVTVDGTGDQDLRPRDPQLITVDIRSATLAIAQTRLCLELTFTGPAPSTAEVELSLTQPHRVRTINGPSVLPVGPTVTFDLNAGDAVAEQQTGGPDRVPMRGVTANRDQQSISLSVPLNELNGIKPSKRFAWSVAALGPDPYAEGFSDKVPNGLHEPTL